MSACGTFFIRHIEVYGEDSRPGLRGVDEEAIPGWEEKVAWNEPILPLNWVRNVELLIDYRHARLKKLFVALP